MLSMQQDLREMSCTLEDLPTLTDDGSYDVTWTVYIALAVGREKDTHGTTVKARRTKNSPHHLVKFHKPQACYHIEYNLMPAAAKTVKVDLIVFGPVAKIYKEDELMIQRTWQEGERIWVGWSQNFNIRVSRDALIDLHSHKIRLQISDTWDNLCVHDRMKTCRVEDAPDTHGDVSTMVNKMRGQRETRTHLWQEDKNHTSSPDLGSVIGLKRTVTNVVELKHAQKTKNTCVEISPLRLFGGETSLTDCFPVCLAGVYEVMSNIKLDRPLISGQLKCELNPLVITILSATSMPSVPVPFSVLQEKCELVYCQYKFPNLNMHRTDYQKHGDTIYFQDVNVILTGLMTPREQQELLSGPPLEIEIHDRDRKLEKKVKPPTKFGTGRDDNTCSNAPSLKQKMMDLNSFGIVSLNLSELLFGKMGLKMWLPIKSCSPPSLDTRRLSAKGQKMTDPAANTEPIPPGHYLIANSQLQVKVEITFPLNVKTDSCEMEPCHGPFGYIIYLFGYNNQTVMTKLRTQLLRINAAAFHLFTDSQEATERALSNYMMNFKPEESNNVDFVTGFHMADQRNHIFVLEGLRDKAIKNLWKAVPPKLSGSEEEQVTVLYNSNLSFFRRIYDSVALRPIFLREPLETIVRQVYLKGPSFHALSRLRQLCQARTLKDVVQYNLLPSSAMILSISKEYGTYDEQLKKDAAEVKLPPRPVRMKRHPPLDTQNREYLRWKHIHQQTMPRNFIQDNIKKVEDDSEQLQNKQPTVLLMEPAPDRPVHIYSIQTYNSKEQAKHLLHKEMAKVPGRKFTYSQQYLSATVEPGQVKSQRDSRDSRDSAIWVTSSDTSHVHPRQPDEARVEELRKPWRENVLHGNTMKPTLSRERWTWSKRHQDFQLYSKPPPQ